MFKIKRETIPTIIIILSIIIALLSFSLIPFTGGDNFAYFHLSRAIAEGKGYIEIWDAQLPLHTQYPPLFPVLLLPAAIINSYLLAKVIVFSCFVFLLFFSYKIFKELNVSKSQELPIIALLFLAFAPALLEYSSTVLSEIPYMLFSVLCLYFWSKRKYNTSLLFAVITFLTRTTGITLLIPVSIYYFLRFKNKKKNLIYLSSVLLSVPLWFIYSFFFKDPYQRSYLQSLLAKDPYTPHLGKINLLDLLNRIWLNIWQMITNIFPELFYGKNINQSISISLGIIIFSLIFLGIFGGKIFTKKTNKNKKESRSKKSTENLIYWYLLLYILITSCWPVIWTVDKRFYLPILPFIAFWMARGIQLISNKIPKSNGKKILTFIIPVILATHFILISLFNAPELWKNNVKWHKQKICPPPPNFFNPYIKVKKWADKENIPDNSVFMARKRRTFYHLTNYRTAKNPKTWDRKNLKNIIETNKVNYIVFHRHSSTTHAFIEGMKDLTEEYSFIPVYSDSTKEINVVKCSKKEIPPVKNPEGPLERNINK